jgi:hypothetical protein
MTLPQEVLDEWTECVLLSAGSVPVHSCFVLAVHSTQNLNFAAVTVVE